MRSRSRILALIASMLAVFGTAVATAGHAAADDGPCTWHISNLPVHFRIGIDHPNLRVGGFCTYADNWFVSFKVRKATGTKASVAGTELDYNGCGGDWYDPNTGDCIDFDTDDEEAEVDYQRLAIVHPGDLELHEVFGDAEDWPGDFDDTYDDSFTPLYFTAKYPTHTRLQIGRDGSRLYFVGSATHYSLTVHGFAPSRGIKVELQRKIGGIWINYKQITTGTNGSKTWATTVARAYTYRLITRENGTQWSSSSGAVRK